MISIIDYGLGNVEAFQNAYRSLNVKVQVCKTHHDIAASKKIILPGVGSFDQAMKLLKKNEMIDIIKELVLVKNVDILGICVGMQILLGSSEEGKEIGLNFIEGSVRKFINNKTKQYPLPHMGWNTIEIDKEEPLFKSIENNSEFYFLHSYYVNPINKKDTISETFYINRFCSTIKRQNIYGVQFHPEKSHQNGIKILENFYKL